MKLKLQNTALDHLITGIASFNDPSEVYVYLPLLNNLLTDPTCLKFRNYARMRKKMVEFDGCCTEMINYWMINRELINSVISAN
jgi:hypothetical protein